MTRPNDLSPGGDEMDLNASAKKGAEPEMTLQMAEGNVSNNGLEGKSPSSHTSSSSQKHHHHHYRHVWAKITNKTTTSSTPMPNPVTGGENEAGGDAASTARSESTSNPTGGTSTATTDTMSISGYSSAVPGAFRVAGLSEESSNGVLDSISLLIGDTPTSTASAARSDRRDDDDQYVTAQAVDHMEIIHEAEENVISRAAKAEVVEVATPTSPVKLFILAIVFLAVVLGLSIGLTRRTSGALKRGEGLVLAEVEYTYEYELDFLKASSFLVEEDGVLVPQATGSSLKISCRPIDCLGDSECVVGKVYEPGCCVGTNCPNGTQCGEICGPPRCAPTRQECRSPACLQCPKGPDGEDIYNLLQYTQSIDCLAYGTKTTEEYGEYNWAIACGPIESGGVVEENRAIGEYVCVALRDGPGIIRHYSANVPCQFFQMVECGCAPSDVYPFGNEPPNADAGWTPCETTEDCPILCSDAGVDNARTACHGFANLEGVESGIDYWEGQNWANFDFFSLDHNHLDGEEIIKIAIYEEATE